MVTTEKPIVATISYARHYAVPPRARRSRRSSRRQTGPAAPPSGQSGAAACRRAPAEHRLRAATGRRAGRGRAAPLSGAPRRLRHERPSRCDRRDRRAAVGARGHVGRGARHRPACGGRPGPSRPGSPPNANAPATRTPISARAASYQAGSDGGAASGCARCEGAARMAAAPRRGRRTGCPGPPRHRTRAGQRTPPASAEGALPSAVGVARVATPAAKCGLASARAVQRPNQQGGGAAPAPRRLAGQRAGAGAPQRARISSRSAGRGGEAQWRL